MRTLFARILLWFLATVAIALLGVYAITAFNAPDPGRPPFPRFASMEVREAREAWETGGAPALAAFLSRLKADAHAEAYFTDANGRDLLTGQSRSDLLAAAAAHRSRRVFLFLHPRPVLARRSRDSAYWLILVFSNRAERVFSPQHVFMLAAVVLLCYGFARYLTSPLRQLQRTLERFGQGDFSARSGSMRQDELGELARTFDQMAERIQTLLAAERRLLLDISHELRSPLARLGVAVELARSGENREAALSRIQKEAERLNALVGELLQVTRAEGDPGSLRTEPLDLGELLASVVDDCSIEARTRGCELKLRAAPAETRGDSELLRRAAENVIRNAIRYAPPETPVEITLQPNGTTATIRVRDYGPGVPEQALSRIFDPFFRVETARDRGTGGVGLGLSIARRAIELHKGNLRARNAKPGLEIEMELPVTAATPH